MPKTGYSRSKVGIEKIEKEIQQINKKRTSNTGYLEAGAVGPIRALIKYMADKDTDKQADKKIKTLLRKKERLQKAIK